MVTPLHIWTNPDGDTVIGAVPANGGVQEPLPWSDLDEALAERYPERFVIPRTETEPTETGE